MKGLGVPFRSSGGAVAFLLPTAGRSRFFCRFCGLPKIICIISIRICTPFPSFWPPAPPLRLRLSAVFFELPIKEKVQGCRCSNYSIAAAVRHGRRVRFIILVILVILDFATSKKCLCIKGFQKGLRCFTPLCAVVHPPYCGALPPFLRFFAPLFRAFLFIGCGSLCLALLFSFQAGCLIRVLLPGDL